MRRAAAALGTVLAAGALLVPVGPALGETVLRDLALAEPVVPVAAGAPVSVVVGAERLPGLITTSITLYPALTDPRDITRPAPDEGVLSRVVSDLAPPSLDVEGRLTVSATTSRDIETEGLWVPGPGIYPITVEVRGQSTSGDELVQRLDTVLIDLGEDPAAEPIRVAPVVGVGADVHVSEEGAVVVDAAGRAQLDADLASLAALGHLPGTAVISPASLELAGTRDLLRRLETLVAGRQVIAPTFVPIDHIGFAALDGQGELQDQLGQGNQVLREQLGVRLDTQSFVADGPLDAQAVAALAGERINQLVVDERDLRDDPAAVFGFGRLVDLEGVRDGPKVVGTSDHVVQAAFATGSVAVDTTTWWARLAFLWLSDPTLARGIVITEDGLGRDLFGDLALYLDAAPGLVRPATLDQLFDDIDGDPAPRQFEDSVPADLSGFVRDLQDARERVEAITRSLPDTDARPDAMALAMQVAPDRRLDATARQRLFDTVSDTVESVEACVVPPGDDDISLFARSATLRLSFGNECSLDLTVVVTLTSETDRVDVDGNESALLVLPAGGVALWEPTIKANTPGQVHLDVGVYTRSFPDRVLQLGPSSEITVNVRTNSGVGVVISVAAGGLLVGWWVVHLRARRRTARLEGEA